MIDASFCTVRNGDIDLHVATVGSGPLILCIHGWPELWISWRHQMQHFSQLGFTVASMDVRGYGGSSKPKEISAYTLTQLCSDAAAVIDALGDGRAIVFGHDWGAPIAWNTARLHPEKVRAVAGLSVPYTPIGPGSSLERAARNPVRSSTSSRSRRVGAAREVMSHTRPARNATTEGPMPGRQTRPT